MRRTLFAVLCLVALVGASSTTITVKPADMKDGETKIVSDDGKSITVRREGDTTSIRIEGAEKTEELTITREGDRIRIGRANGRSLVIDGFKLEDLDRAPRFRAFPQERLQTYFVCPKDKTTLRVPKENADDTFKCPVDGTTMEKRKGHGIMFFFDDSSIEL